jgi:hypothetical protein
MGKKFGRYLKKSLGYSLIILFSMSCGTGKERVDTIKGPKGDKGDTGQSGQIGQQGPKGDRGDRGDKGERGDQGPVVVQTPQPQPTIVPIPVPPIPQPPVIIYPPYPSDPGNYCSGCIIVCACLNGSWQSIIINVHERYRYNIKNDGACY